jgi:riboflavin kinase/FMN adenylyltransferase
MLIHRGYENLNLEEPVVTLGIFDGVHRGHRALIDCLVSRAKEEKKESAVITFSPHPRLILDQSSRGLSFLNSMEEKIYHLENANVDHLIIVDFNKEFGNTTACNFIKEVLIKNIGTKHLLIGYNHHFGKSGEGDYNTIKQCTNSLDFQVEKVPAYNIDGGTISSSSIRESLIKGKITEANRWLGYSYSVTGTVVHGREIGRTIGFPTANIKPNDIHKLIPGTGVYAVHVSYNSIMYPGMLSIGSNPTVNDDVEKKSIEVHIMNFDEDIYGKEITLIFRNWLRNEIKFENITRLTDQIKLDKQQVLQLLT